MIGHIKRVLSSALTGSMSPLEAYQRKCSVKVDKWGDPDNHPTYGGTWTCDKCGLCCDRGVIEYGRDYRNAETKMKNPGAPAETLTYHVDIEEAKGSPYLWRSLKGKTLVKDNPEYFATLESAVEAARTFARSRTGFPFSRIFVYAVVKGHEDKDSRKRWEIDISSFEAKEF